MSQDRRPPRKAASPPDASPSDDAGAGADTDAAQPADAQSLRLKRLREWRSRPDQDCSMQFLAEHFERSIEKPHKQVAKISEVWDQCAPDVVKEHARLEQFVRGVLRIVVDSSAIRFELDRQLRQGLERQMLQRGRPAGLRRIEVRVGRL